MSPRKQEKLYLKDYAPELVRIAEADILSAQVLARTPEVRRENSAYHAQQCVEKAIKAVLCWKGIPVPLVHDAGILVAKLPSELSPPGGYDLTELTPFATVKRYEEGNYEFTEAELKAVIALAVDVLKWAKAQIK